MFRPVTPSNDGQDRSNISQDGALPESKCSFDIDQVLQRLDSFHSKIAGVSYTVRYAPTIDSTMNVAAFCADESNDTSLSPGLVLVAGNQTQGIGLSGPWVSEDQDVKMTVVLPEAQDPQQQLMLQVASAVAGVETIKGLAREQHVQVEFKWPNDIYGWIPSTDSHTLVPRKVSGLLLASKFRPDIVDRMRLKGYQVPEGVLLAGVGITLGEDLVSTQSVVRGEETVPLSTIATSVQKLTGALLSRESVVATYVEQLDRFAALAYHRQYQVLLDRAFPLLLLGHSKQVQIETNSFGSVVGEISAITPDYFEIKRQGGDSAVVELPLAEAKRIFPVGYRPDL